MQWNKIDELMWKTDFCVLSGGSSSVGPEVVVGPKDTTASQGDYTVDFECIINAR
jgi:hypothetical protein